MSGKFNSCTTSHKAQVPIDCIICSDPCNAVCVFPCGHYTCYSCGLRIHSLSRNGCPVCRKQGDGLPIITQVVSEEEEQYSQSEIAELRRVTVQDRQLQCVITGDQLAAEVAKLYEYSCPIASCWCRGAQDPFLELAMLKDHLEVEHKLAYCEVCLTHRPVFLCEQLAYSPAALQQHVDGHCSADHLSFTGHPQCKFCKKRRFYDGEALLRHMQESHFTCDVCNRGQFTFTFYATRQKLDQHFQSCHKICDHPDCASLDLLVRVFGNEIDLIAHRQRVHGIKSKLSLTPAMFGDAPSAPLGSGGGTTPATASNTNVIQITFDHIYRRETVEMMPTKAQQRQRNGGTHRGHGKSNPPPNVYAPTENGVPSHYQRQGAMQRMTRGVAVEGKSSNASSPTSSSSPRVPAQSGRRGGAATSAAAGSSSAFGVAEDMDHYNIAHDIPTDKKKLEEKLNALLRTHLPSPVTYAHFKGYTLEFIQSSLLTSKYFDLLASECFPNPAVFHEIFPLIVATVPDAAKKSALQEVYKMRMAPEIQRLTKAREEDARKAAAAAAVASKAHRGRGGAAMPFATGGQKKVGRGGNAWLGNNMQSKLRVVQQGSEAVGETPAGSSSGAQPDVRGWRHPTETYADPASSEANFSAPAVSSPTAAPSLGRGLVMSEENFPSLPRTGVRRTLGAKKTGKGTNAWFSR